MKHTAFYRHLHLAVTVFLLGCLLLTAALPAFAAYPKEDHNIADEAKVLSESTIRTIKTTNASLEEDLGVSIAVCTVKTVGNTEIREYAAGLFRDWKLGEGVLLLIAAEDQNYYFIQSTGVEKIITNDVLAEVRNEYLEKDFASGNIDRGVLKTVSRLSSLLVSGFADLASAAEEDESADADSEKGTTIGSVIIGLFKFVLFVVLFAIAAFVLLFIAALFNDDCAAILQKYVFQRGKNTSIQQNYYDERLYGQPRRTQNPNQPPRRPNPNAQQRPQNRPNPAQGYNRPANPYAQQGYAQNRPYRQNAARPNGYLPSGSGHGSGYGSGYGSGSGYGHGNANIPAQQNRQTTYYNADGSERRAPQRQPQSRQQNQQMNGDETRAFTIPTRDNRY